MYLARCTIPGSGTLNFSEALGIPFAATLMILVHSCRENLVCTFSSSAVEAAISERHSQASFVDLSKTGQLSRKLDERNLEARREKKHQTTG